MSFRHGAFLAPLPISAVETERTKLQNGSLGKNSAKQLSVSTPRRARFPQRYTIRVSADGMEDEHVEPTDANANAKSSQRLNKKPTSVRPQRDAGMLRVRLVNILSALINLDSQRSTIEQLIVELESMNSTPATEAFTELVLAGDWVLLFSSMTTKAQGNVRLREIGQCIDVEKKELVNRALWGYQTPDDTYHFYAELLITCSYKFVSAGTLEITIGGHKIKVIDRGPEETKMPPGDGMKEVVQEVQRSLPIDFFDPSGLMDISYLEPSFRISKFVGKRMAGVRNVFVRKSTKPKLAD